MPKIPSCLDTVLKEMSTTGIPKNRSYLKPAKVEEKPKMNKGEMDRKREMEEKRHQKKLN